MKRNITILALAAAMVLLGAAPAFATHPEPIPASDAAPPNTVDCRPGGNSHITGHWTMMTQLQYEDMLLAGLAERGIYADTELPPERIRPGGDDGTIDTWGELVPASATATWDFCDHNDDGFACVMKQTFPVDAPPFTLTILDNHPFPS